MTTINKMEVSTQYINLSTWANGNKVLKLHQSWQLEGIFSNLLKTNPWNNEISNNAFRSLVFLRKTDHLEII